MFFKINERKIYKMEENDWRLWDDSDCFRNEKFYFRKYKKSSERWDHEHCNFCWARISEYDDELNEGYCTVKDELWVCPQCFNDFKEKFNLEVVDDINLDKKIVMIHLKGVSKKY